MRREHGILAALVVAAALWAYFVAHPLGGAVPSGPAVVRVWDVPLTAVTSLTFRDGAVQAKLEARPQEAGATPYLWVEAEIPTRPPPPMRPPPGKAAPPPPPPTRETVSFRGNATALQVLRAFATLAAERDLGALAALDAKTFGLPSQDAYLELQRQGAGPLRLELGRATYGEAGRYAHNPANDHLYLLRAQELRQLATAPGSLMDPNLLGLRTEQAQRIELVAGGSTRTFHRLAAPGQWGSSAEAKEPTAELPPLLALLDSLRVLRYRGKADAAATTAAGAPALEVRLFRGAAPEPDAWLRLFPLGATPAATGVSSYTQAPVELARQPVQQVLEKARGLLHST